MPQFAYSAINAEGVELAGEVSAPDISSAREILLGGGLLAERINQVAFDGTKAKSSFGKKVKPKSLQVFSRQFATMIEAGLSVVTALVILEQQTDDKALAVVIDDVREQV
jgi:type IV pilus assembly protein PilC